MRDIARGSFAAGFVLFLAAAAPASAQSEQKGATQISVMGGAYLGGTVYTGESGTLTRNVDVQNDWDYGGKLGYVFNQLLGLEFGYSRSNSGLQLEPGTGKPAAPIGDLTENRYDLNLNFFTHPNNVQGYFTLGGGATHFGANFDDGSGSPPKSVSDTRFSSNFGIGMLLHTSPKMALRLDGRWRYTDTNVGGQDYYCDAYGFCYSYDSSFYSSGQITGGVTYSLH
jgi:hypothetical protein